MGMAVSPTMLRAFSWVKAWAKSWTRVWWASKAVVMTSRPSIISCCQPCWLKASEMD